MAGVRLIDFLKLIESDPFPLEYNSTFDSFTEFRTPFEVNLQFGEDQYARCNITSPVLVPWYDATIRSICPVDDHCIDIWLDSSGIRNIYPEYIEEVKAYVPNNKSDISNP